jgi:Phage integrase family
MAATNPVCKVKFFNTSNERVRYLQDDEWDRLHGAALKLEGRSPHLADKMVLARNTGLRRSNLSRAEWDWVDWLNKVVRVPKTKNNRAYAVPLNDTAHEIVKRLYSARDVELASPYIFVHPRGARHAGKPVLDVKNAFGTALEEAGIHNFTWHDFRHDYASRLVMAGVSLRAVAELLGHKGLRMVMRYAHLAPGYLSDEVRKLDTFRLVDRSTERARKGQGRSNGNPREAKAPRFARKSDSSGWTRTSNPPVNSLMQVSGLAGSRAGSSDGILLIPGVREKIGQRLARRIVGHRAADMQTPSGRASVHRGHRRMTPTPRRRLSTFEKFCPIEFSVATTPLGLGKDHTLSERQPSAEQHRSRERHQCESLGAGRVVQAVIKCGKKDALAAFAL